MKEVSPKIPILSVFFFDQFAFAVILPLFAHVILRSIHEIVPRSTSLENKFFILGTLLAVFAVFQFLGTPLLQKIAALKGEKKTLVLTLSCLSLGSFFTAWSLYTANIYLLFISRAITGFFTANKSICLESLKTTWKPLQNHLKALTTIEGISFTIAVLLGGFFSDASISHHFFISLPLWVTFVYCLLNLLAILLSGGKTKILSKKYTSFSYLVPFKALLSPSIIHFFLILSWITMLQFNSAFLIEKFNASLLHITFSYVIVGVLWTVSSRMTYSYLSKQRNLKPLLSVGFFLLFVCMLICFFSFNFIFYLIFLFLASILSAVLWPSSLTAIQDLSRKNTQKFHQPLKSLALFIGPLVVMFLMYRNSNYLHLFTSSSALLGFFMIFVFLKPQKKAVKT